MHLIMMLACSGEPSTDNPADTADTAGAATDSGADSTVEIPDQTFGQTPSASLPAPTFSATNYDGGTRGIDDLTDGPTVVWFFPSAGTYG